MAEPWKHQVSLRGSSAKEITRDALLQKVSKERELRNFSRRASAAALFIQRVWRRYSVAKKVAVEVREEWEAQVSDYNVPITRIWVSSTLLRPFLFFITCPSFTNQKRQAANRRCMVTCFKILLQSINSTEPQKNFCCLAIGSLVERRIWLCQAQKVILMCLSLLAEFHSSSPVDQDTNICTSLAVRIMVALTDLKGWKCVTDENSRDADIAISNLVKHIATGKHHLYFCIRSYFIKLDSHISPQRNSDLQSDDHFLVTASAITIALRPFQIGKSDVKTAVHMEVQDAVEKYCVYLLTVPWLVQRLPTVLKPALKHKSVLLPCLKTLLVRLIEHTQAVFGQLRSRENRLNVVLGLLFEVVDAPSVLPTLPNLRLNLNKVVFSIAAGIVRSGVVANAPATVTAVNLKISKEKIFLEMSMLDQPGFSSKKIPSVGWILANIINLTTECENDNLDSGKLSEGINCRMYVVAITIAAEKLLDWLESAELAKKTHNSMGHTDALTGTSNSDTWESETTFGSLKLSYVDLLRPVLQQWHLMVLLALTKRDSSVQNSNTLPNTRVEDLEKFKLLEIAYLYSYMLRVLALLNPKTGSLPLLNMLSFTPGFLLDLWEALEGAIFFGNRHTPVNHKYCKGSTSSGQIDGGCEKKQKWASKDAGNKWASVLQKISRKSPTNAEYEDSVNDPPGDFLVGEDPSDLWDVELFKRGLRGIAKDIACMLHLFCSTYSHLLLVLDDIEFYEKQAPFKLEQQRKITAMLNTMVYNGFSHSNNRENIPLMDAAVRCLHLLYERDCRQQFCPPHLWLAPARTNRPPIAAAARAHEAISITPRSEDAFISSGMGSVITVTPHVFPFEERVQMFREFIKLDKVSRRVAGEVAGPGPGTIEIVIRRSHIVEDGFKQLNNLGSKLKSCIHVSFVSECGLPEAGLDYGGLSKEFLTDISKTAFDPDYGLFSQTSTSERHIIPNASARLIENGIQMIEFLGRIVGKALYEGILLDYCFSHVFVQKLLGRYSFLDELSTLDPELYRNLMYVKHYDGEVKELSLDFTVTDEYLGKHVVTELKPGGKDVAVTNENKLQYIHAIADYKLNWQILPLANAFYRGLIDLISPSWLSLFNAGEFNQLLSGGNHDIDVDDLRNNTRYTGGYSGSSRTIKIFWEVLAGFEPKERCMLLKFVTSCSRAPLLGFKHLQPAFTIHKVSCSVPLWATIGGQDVDRLPSASTCYNTLKLPTYKRAITMKAKLLYAISSNAGFELS